MHHVFLRLKVTIFLRPRAGYRAPPPPPHPHPVRPLMFCPSVVLMFPGFVRTPPPPLPIPPAKSSITWQLFVPDKPAI